MKYHFQSFCERRMSASKSKTVSGAEFSADEQLEVNDVSDWLVDRIGGESAKGVLDDFGWDGGAVAGITIMTSPDNRKVTNANIFMAGELMRNQKEIKANRIFGEADKDLRIQNQIEDASVFTFKKGTPVGDFIDDDKISWTVVKKTSRGTSEVMDIADYEANKISGGFSIRPYVVPVSANKAKLTLVVYPGHREELLSQHAHAQNVSFSWLGAAISRHQPLSPDE